MKVPFLDLKAQYESIKEEIDSAIAQVIANTSFAGGPLVKEFEESFANYCQVSHAVGCGSGTDALQLALMAAGIGPGDEVITVPNTFIATVEAICLCGATPVFVDVKEDDFTMNPDLLEAAITAKTKAVIPVHLYGQTADMDPILEFGKANKLLVIEDACQAHGAEYKGRPAGSMGDMACFSFYPGKNLGAFGEAGAVVTDRQDLFDIMIMLRDHGQSRKYYHDYIGWNSRMDGLQGAVLNVKLKHLDQWNARRIEIAQRYNNELTDVDGLTTPTCLEGNKHIYHLYAIMTEKRDFLLNKLKESEVFCGIHYPVPVHKQKAFETLIRGENSYPIAEGNAAMELSLPMYPHMTDEQVEYTISAIIKAF